MPDQVTHTKQADNLEST